MSFNPNVSNDVILRGSNKNLKRRIIYKSENGTAKESSSPKKKKGRKSRKSLLKLNNTNNESSAVPEMLSSSNRSFKSRIVFEYEDEIAKETNSHSKKSSKSDNISSNPKIIQVRKDLFDGSNSSATVISPKKESSSSSTDEDLTNTEEMLRNSDSPRLFLDDMISEEIVMENTESSDEVKVEVVKLDVDDMRFYTMSPNGTVNPLNSVFPDSLEANPSSPVADSTDFTLWSSPRRQMKCDSEEETQIDEASEIDRACATSPAPAQLSDEPTESPTPTSSYYPEDAGDLEADSDSEEDEKPSNEIWLVSPVVLTHPTTIAAASPAIVTKDIHPRLKDALDQMDVENDAAVRTLTPADNLVFDWKSDLSIFTGVRENFTGTPGPTFPKSHMKSPVHSFLKIWDEEIMMSIVKETNNHASQYLATADLEADPRLKLWHPTTVNELYVYFALMLHQSLTPFTVEYQYVYPSSRLTEAPYFKDYISFDRLVLLNKFIHFADTSNIPSTLSLEERWIYKIQPIMDHLNRRFQALYLPGRNIAIDDSLLRWHGNLTFINKIAMKTAKADIKSYELCESKTGYLWKFVIKTGATSERPEQTRPDKTDNPPDETRQRPDKTSDRPKETSDRPKETSERPDKNSGRQDKTSERPDETSDRIDKTSVRPDETSDRPNETIDRQDETSCRSDETIDRPDETIDRPDKSSDRPDKNSEQADKNSDRPDKTSDQTDKTSEQPDKNSGRPDKTSDQPDKTSEQPDKNSGPPDKTSEQPDKNSGRPDKTSEQPDKTSEQPDKNSGRPDKTSDQPDKNSGPPDKTSEQPDKNSGRPDKTSEQPDKNSGRPDKTSDRSDNTSDRLAADCPTAATAKIVYDLASPLFHKGYTLIMDSFYNSPLFARCLKLKGTDCYGTLRLNRENMPICMKSLKEKQLKNGDVVSSTSGDVNVSVCKDSNIFAMISTYHQVKSVNGCSNDKPQVVIDYDKSMAGIDKKDKVLTKFSLEWNRSSIGYKKFFRRLLNASVQNAFILYRGVDKSISHRKFREQLADGLLKYFFQQRVPTSSNAVRIRQLPVLSRDTPRPILENNHFSVRIENKLMRQCVWCSMNSKSKRTSRKCDICDVPLCIRCMKPYHSRLRPPV